MGEAVVMAFALVSSAPRPQKLAIDYIVDFIKKSGKVSPKVKLKEIVLGPGERRELTQRHRFVDRTVRTHHAGDHRVTLLINGPCGQTEPSGSILFDWFRARDYDRGRTSLRPSWTSS